MDAAHFQPIAIAALAAGGMVFSAVLYALCYAFWRQRSDTRYLLCTVASYLLLIFAAGVLQQQLALSGVWSALIVCLLVGYLIAPALIWRLSVATHADSHADTHAPMRAPRPGDE